MDGKKTKETTTLPNRRNVKQTEGGMLMLLGNDNNDYVNEVNDTSTGVTTKATTTTTIQGSAYTANSSVVSGSTMSTTPPRRRQRKKLFAVPFFRGVGVAGASSKSVTNGSENDNGDQQYQLLQTPTANKSSHKDRVTSTRTEATKTPPTNPPDGTTSPDDVDHEVGGAIYSTRNSTPTTPRSLVHVETDDRVEVISPDTPHATSRRGEGDFRADDDGDQEEEPGVISVRKQLFVELDDPDMIARFKPTLRDSSPEQFHRTATLKSVEVLPNGEYMTAVDDSFKLDQRNEESISKGLAETSFFTTDSSYEVAGSDFISVNPPSNEVELVEKGLPCLPIPVEESPSTTLSRQAGPVLVDTPDSDSFRSPVSVDTPERYLAAKPLPTSNAGVAARTAAATTAPRRGSRPFDENADFALDEMVLIEEETVQRQKQKIQGDENGDGNGTEKSNKAPAAIVTSLESQRESSMLGAEEQFRIPQATLVEESPKRFLNIDPFSSNENDNFANFADHFDDPFEAMRSSSQDNLAEDLRDISTLGASLISEPYPGQAAKPNRFAKHPPIITIEERQSEEKEGISGHFLNVFQCSPSLEEIPRLTNRNIFESMQNSLQSLAISPNVHKVVDLVSGTVCAKDSAQDKIVPCYDEVFTQRFLRRMTTKGVAVLYLQAPGTLGNHSLDWKGRTVAMLLEKGGSGVSPTDSVQPRLEWTTIAGGQNFDVSTFSVGLLNIMSIASTLERPEDESHSSRGSDDDSLEDHLCFFTITTHQGDVHVFETNSPEERDSLVNGLRNVISRLALQLIMGDVSAFMELYHDDLHSASPDSTALLLPVVNQRQMMNEAAHILLN